MEISIIVNKNQLQIIKNAINNKKLTKVEKEELEMISEMIQDVIDENIVEDTVFDFTE